MVIIVVGGHLLEGTFQVRFDFVEALFLGGDEEVFSIDEGMAVVGHWCSC